MRGSSPLQGLPCSALRSSYRALPTYAVPKYSCLVKTESESKKHEDFTLTWEQRKLGELYKTAGSGGTPTTANREFYKGEIPFLGISDMDARDIFATEKAISQAGLDSCAAWIVPAGAISLAMYASVGKVGILRQDIATSQAFFNMVFDDEGVRDFVFARLERANAEAEWEPWISMGTQRNLNAKKVRQFTVSVPSKRELLRIGAFFRSLDDLITLHQCK